MKIEKETKNHGKHAITTATADTATHTAHKATDWFIGRIPWNTAAWLLLKTLTVSAKFVALPRIRNPLRQRFLTKSIFYVSCERRVTSFT